MSGLHFHRNVFLIALVVHLITAWFSTGYHSADEHFQIIAFAQWKLGELPKEHLAWEFDAGIRSSVQPWVAVAVFRSAEAAGLGDPFTRTFLLRLLTAVLAVFALHGFVRSTVPTIGQRWHKAYIILAYLLWFLPFLHVRFSSEGWSGIFLLFMFACVLRRGKSWAVQAGLCAGIAVLCRPPTALIALSTLVWMLTVRKEPFRGALFLALGASVTLAAGSLLDHLFYERFTPTIYNYVRMGIFGDTGHRFDELPWFYYPPWIVKYALPPIGAAMLIGFLVLMVQHPRHLAVWCALPYLLMHTLIAHKELRFLYPLADLVPWILISAWSSLPKLHGIANARVWVVGLVTVFVLPNMLALAVVMSSPAGEGRVVLAKKLHEEAKRGDRIAYLVEPDLAWRIALPEFYRPAGTEEVALSTTATSDVAHVDFLVAHPAEADAFAARHGLALHAMVATERPWAATLMRWYTWNEGPAPWTLFRVENRR